MDLHIHGTSLVGIVQYGGDGINLQINLHNMNATPVGDWDKLILDKSR